MVNIWSIYYGLIIYHLKSSAHILFWSKITYVLRIQHVTMTTDHITVNAIEVMKVSYYKGTEGYN